MIERREGDTSVDPGDEARALELAEGMARLSTKVDLAERFLANAAHEMKTPLANVRGELQLALMRERSAEEYKNAIQAALLHTERLIELTNDLLTFAKVSYRPVLPPVEPCQLKAILSNAFQIAAQRYGAERAFELALDDELVVSGRGDELTRLFRNLLENALNYSPPGSAVSVNVDRLGREAVIAVENEGAPITPEVAETIFLPFQRGSSSGSGGFGLGLGIARAIARAHEGELVADTRAARPRFVVTLPVAAP
jgi:two-component system OmpR family sensor kinase